MQSLDPHERPPDGIRRVYKKYQRMKPQDLEHDAGIVDVGRIPSNKMRIVKEWDREQLIATFRRFAGDSAGPDPLPSTSSISAYEHEDMPGR